ncbi:MAG TPA: thiamine-phosphate kinase [Lentisphaeria bacterium]|nr:MAG: thiamine-phosphate kinase [Lentisphaerae bacterium GWF2_50_93]HCE43861.1 thiamine-phosphate kinase [Lentisphaeria bacterium]
MKEKDIHSLIFRTFRQDRSVVVGPGDDCAALDIGGGRLFLMAVDQVVSDVHYLREKTSASETAVKLLNRNLSDIAAMGGEPAFALLTIASKSADSRWITGFLGAIQKEAAKWKISICGGDISSTPKDVTVCTLTITGWVDKKRICLRKEARAGDLLYATGCFGNSFKSGHHLKFMPRIEAGKFLAGKYTRCMIDVSDGLLADSKRICEASKVSLVMDESSIPLRKGADIMSALSEGEDYELIFAVSPSNAARLEKEWPFKNIRLSRIGRFVPGGKGNIFGADRKLLTSKYKAGYEHFGS